MTKLPVFILTLALVISCKASIETFQTEDPNKLGVNSHKFSGTIFKNTYPADKFYIQSANTSNRFTPTKADIDLAERILRNQIERLNRPRINQFERGQYIDKHLKKYFRQYIGFINEQGDSIIHINFHWDRFTIIDRLKGYWDDRLQYTSDYSIVFDGGSRYWNVNANLTTRKLFELSVNGIG